MFFSPEVYSSSYSTPLPEVVDGVIQSCPIDTRRALYSNIVLSVSLAAAGLVASFIAAGATVAPSLISGTREMLMPGALTAGLERSAGTTADC